MLNLGVALKAAIFPSVGASSKSGAVHTFGWMFRWRRLVSYYEQRTDVSTAIHVAMSDLLMRRLFD